MSARDGEGEGERECRRERGGDGGTPMPCSGPFPRGNLAGGTWRMGRFHLPCLK